jgi:hypothetical protein
LFAMGFVGVTALAAKCGCPGAVDGRQMEWYLRRGYGVHFLVADRLRHGDDWAVVFWCC